MFHDTKVEGRCPFHYPDIKKNKLDNRITETMVLKIKVI